jgi:quercetin dioxygenase-like cupin family protein
MDLQKMKILKEDERGMIYYCEKVNLILRKKGARGADHTHEMPEILYLIKGKLKLTIGEETKIVEAPTRISIGPNVYHKDLALTDIEMIEIKDEGVENPYIK